MMDQNTLKPIYNIIYNAPFSRNVYRMKKIYNDMAHAQNKFNGIELFNSRQHGRPFLRVLKQSPNEMFHFLAGEQ